VLDRYLGAREAGLRPALLETVTPGEDRGSTADVSIAAGEGAADRPRGPGGGGLSLLGVAPGRVLEVVGGRTLLDSRDVGGPLEILRLLEEGLGNRWFPAWIGFFAYEYARHLGLRTRDPLPGLPEAHFRLYPEGFVARGGTLVEAPDAPGFDPIPLPPGALPPVEPEAELSPEEHLERVRAIQARIRAGDVYQVNLSHRFRFPSRSVDPARLYDRLRTLNPSPYMGLIEGDGWAVVSGSPERLFALAPEGADGTREIRARPIAGTRPRGADPREDEALERELRSSPKERAEHVMLVDLLRNDLARCCEPGTVEVSEAFTVERYSHVMHLVSEVRGRTRARLGEIVAAAFPGGSITGAPKASVMEALAELEPVPRGSYTGSLGYVSGRGVDLNILIRSFTFAGDDAYLSAGGGVVIDSEPIPELDEARAKAQALLLALGGGRPGRPPEPPRLDGAWRPPRPPRRHDAQVIFVENRDSFSFNVVDYLRALGAEVRVVDAAAAADLGGATHVVVGPGPGEPAAAGRTLEWILAARGARLPLLGICLGHQALGVALGGRLARAPEAVHGRAASVRHSGEGIFAGIPSPAIFARYHSLCLTDLPPGVRSHAASEDGVCMAISDDAGLAWGVQFHPESMLSAAGMQLVSAFLSLERR